MSLKMPPTPKSLHFKFKWPRLDHILIIHLLLSACSLSLFSLHETTAFIGFIGSAFATAAHTHFLLASGESNHFKPHIPLWLFLYRGFNCCWISAVFLVPKPVRWACWNKLKPQEIIVRFDLWSLANSNILGKQDAHHRLVILHPTPWIPWMPFLFKWILRSPAIAI